MSDQKVTKNKKVPQKKSFKSLEIIAVVLVIIAGLVLIDMKTPVGGQIRFYQAWNRCGNRPYMKDGLPGTGISFYQLAPLDGIFRGIYTKYYCTALEAEQAGLSADPQVYSFPELDKLKAK